MLTWRHMIGSWPFCHTDVLLVDINMTRGKVLLKSERRVVLMWHPTWYAEVASWPCFASVTNDMADNLTCGCSDPGEVLWQMANMIRRIILTRTVSLGHPNPWLGLVAHEFSYSPTDANVTGTLTGGMLPMPFSGKKMLSFQARVIPFWDHFCSNFLFKLISYMLVFVNYNLDQFSMINSIKWTPFYF